MTDMIRGILALLTLLNSDVVPEPAGPSLRSGSIGVVYVMRRTPEDIELRLVFADRAVERYPDSFPNGQSPYDVTLPVSSEGRLVIFDEFGETATLDQSPSFRLVFWCEHDGGIQYRPETTVMIAKSQLRRSLNPVAAIQGAAAFGVFEGRAQRPESKTEPPKPSSDTLDTRLVGRLERFGPVVPYVFVEPDDAQNCDGEPANNLRATLATVKGEADLRCCGP